MADEPSRAEASTALVAAGQVGARRRGQPGPGPDPALAARPDPGDVAHQLLPARAGRRPQELRVVQARPEGGARPARAAAGVRDLGLLAAGRGRAPAVRQGRPRRAALERPARGLPHRDPRPGQGPDGQERRHRADRRQGRLRPQAGSVDDGRPRGLAGRGRRLLHDVHLGAARHHRQPGRRPGGRRPQRVVRHDGDDTYLVVAADKGTATFSDIANGVAIEYGFWLGDAFASGGSAGYDHKAMGITAKGAWESVKRHFRELGVDTQSAGLHRGRRRRHVAATSSATACCCRSTSGWWRRSTTGTSSSTRTRTRESSFAERRRLFDLPRSSWADYDRALISEGGGIFAARREVGAGQRADGGRARDCRGRRDHADAGRADEGDPRRARRPAVERRDRHLRQGVHRVQRRGRRPGERRDPGQRRRAALPRRRRGRQPRADPARPDRGRAARRPGQHRRHRQLGRRRLLRPRGQHQDHARPGRGRRRPHHQAAQRAAGRHDRRRLATGAARQLRAERPARQRPRPGALDAPGAPAADPLDGGARRPGPGHRVPARRTPRSPAGTRSTWA